MFPGLLFSDYYYSVSSFWAAQQRSHLKWKWKLFSRVWLFATPWTVVHGILQARILEWVAVPFFRRSSQLRDRPQVSHIAGGFFTSWATREAHMWNLEKRCWWTYLRNGNRDRDVENKRGHQGGMGWIGKLGLTCILLCIKQIISENALSSAGNSAQCSMAT